MSLGRNRNATIAIVILWSFLKLQAQNNAYIYRDSVLAITPGYLSAIKKMDSLKASYGREIYEANQQLEGKINRLVNPYKPLKNEPIEMIMKRMSPNDTTQLGIYIKEGRFISEKAKTYNKLYLQAFDNEVQSILNKIDAIIYKYAQANKIDYVFIMEEFRKIIAYMNTKKDITLAIMKEIQKVE